MSDIVKRERPPLPVVRISGLGPGLSKVREGLAVLRSEHDGLAADVEAYTTAVGMVRDHVRNLHEDLQFEVSDRGNGGGTASQERVEAHVREILEDGKEPEEPVAPLPPALPAT